MFGGPTASASPVPSITSFTPASATVGTVITIEGSGLSGATEVAFNFISAPITSDTDTEITTTVPLGEDSGPLSVTTPGGTALSSTNFTLLGFYITTDTVPGARRGFAYSQQLAVAGGKGPYKWKKTAGKLPKGMTMSSAGVLSAVFIPTKDVAGTYPFTVRVKDSTRHGHLMATETYSLVVS
jgi:hypothetical protein